MIKKRILSLSLFTAITLPSLAQAAPADDLTSYLGQSVAFKATYTYTTSDGKSGSVNLDVTRPANFILTYTTAPDSKTISNGSVVYIETYGGSKNSVTKMSATAYPYWDEPYVLFSRNSLSDWSNYNIAEEAYNDGTAIPKLKFTLTPLSNDNRRVRSFTVIFENKTPFNKNFIYEFTSYYDNGQYIKYHRATPESRYDGSNGTEKYNKQDSYYKGWNQTGF